MPVRLEHIRTPSAQDWIDLGKIHADTQPLGLKMDSTALGDWLQQPNHWLLAGRFNDRIVGCLLAQQQGEVVVLSNAAVRTITQRRGVMHQLLHHVCDWAQHESLALEFHAVPSELEDAVKTRGFLLINNIYRHNNLNKS
ncbi:hypothetical protein CHH28_01735 [Bacterioplanes sanyensis]|uniref:N-acetyltransferase domain-containing protein n=1 Tax=Bacterioplanes sanyensis TaxID=1249553 RepID=A0A222FG48_9GAMM|nr:acetyl-CoA sensor PanZ family protein [Bacterioplanes sanyensis]ASP37474.1 hypothetical protein CHH28_01735 [Bacterioplanes sanyensis]